MMMIVPGPEVLEDMAAVVELWFSRCLKYCDRFSTLDCDDCDHMKSYIFSCCEHFLKS